FETLDRALVLFLVGIYIAEVGWQMYVYTQNPPYNPTNDIIAIIILGLATIATLRVPPQFARISYIPLLILAFFIFFSMYIPHADKNPLLPSLPEQMVNSYQFIILGGIFLALVLFWSIFLRRPSRPITTLAIYSIALLCITLQTFVWNNAATSLTYCPQPFSIPTILLTTFDDTVTFILVSAIAIGILFSFASPFLHLLPYNTRRDKILRTTDQGTHLVEHLMVLSSITLCTLAQWNFGCHEPLFFNINGWDAMLPVIALMFVVKLLNFR